MDACSGDEADSPDESAEMAASNTIETVATMEKGFDRKSAFIILTDPEAGCRAYFGKRTYSVAMFNRPKDKRKETVIAVGVRERGTDKACCVIRFLYAVPQSIADAIKTWVAVPRYNFEDKCLLFNGGEYDMSDLKKSLEDRLKNESIVLTKCQRCADWFVLRQFRITGTIAGRILLTDSVIRSKIGRSTDLETPMTTADCFKRLVSSWISSARSTEHMMRGTRNEGNVINALRGKPLVRQIHECGMIAHKQEPWLV